MTRSNLRVVRTLTVGVELEADLTKPLSDSDQQTLVELYHRHHLVLFRGQQLTPEQHKRVGSYLGPVPEDRGDDLAVHQIAKDGALGAGELVFHSDLSFDPEPYHSVSLLALEIDPPGGTSTRFVDAEAALRRLPESLRQRIGDRTTLHIFPIDTAVRSVHQERPTEFPSARHPIIMEHPESGLSFLYVSFQASTDVSDMDQHEGEALLGELFDVLYDAAHEYEHRWHPGDLIFWDNLVVQHARGDQSQVSRRTMQRLVLTPVTVQQRYGEFFESSAEYLGRVSRR